MPYRGSYDLAIREKTMPEENQPSFGMDKSKKGR